jgi:hypothetical protein
MTLRGSDKSVFSIELSFFSKDARRWFGEQRMRNPLLTHERSLFKT